MQEQVLGGRRVSSSTLERDFLPHHSLHFSSLSSTLFTIRKHVPNASSLLRVCDRRGHVPSTRSYQQKQR